MTKSSECIGIRCAEMALELRRTLLNVPDGDLYPYDEGAIKDTIIRLEWTGRQIAGIYIEGGK